MAIYTHIDTTISQLSLPTGLENFGNTCYMNATLQCFKVVPELRDALQRYRGRLAQLPLCDACLW